MVHYKVTDIGIFVNEEYILRSFPSPAPSRQPAKISIP
jgi:hypothetical protein